MQNQNNKPPRVILVLTNLPLQITMGVITGFLIVVFIVSAFVYNPLIGVVLDVTEYPARVIDVVKDTPAELAGILLNDQVQAIDGRTVPAWGNEPIYRAGIKAGEIVTFEILRDGQPLTFQIPTGEALLVPNWLALNVALALLPFGFWLIGLVLVLFAAEGAYPARLFGLHWMLTGLSLAAAIFGRAGYFWGANTVFLVCWAWLMYTNIAVYVYFPVTSTGRKGQTRALSLLGLGAVGFSLFAIVVDWVLFPNAWRQGQEAYQAFLPLGLSVAWLIPGGYFLSFLGGIGILLGKHLRFRRTAPHLSQQTRLVIVGMGFAILPLLLLTFIPYLLTGAPLLNQNYGFLFFLLMPLAFAYALFQKKLIHIDLMINRAVVIFLMVLTILSLSSLVILIVMRWFALPETLFPLLGGSMALVVALPTASLRDRYQVFVNRVMYGEHYDYLSITSDFSSQLAKTMERTKLVELLGTALPRQMGLQSAQLFLTEENHLTAQGTEAPLSLATDSPFCRTLQTHPVPTAAQDLPVPAPETLAWGQLFSPLVFEKQLVGLLVLGPRLKGDFYHAQDLQIITTLSQQAALAYTNVQLVERLRGLTHRLVQDDETRRRAVASELHDAVLQNLFFVKNRIMHTPGQEDVTGILDGCVRQLRQTLRELRPSILDQTLDIALQDLVLDLQKKAGSSPKIIWAEGVEVPFQMDEERKTAVYRIAQEAIINALKHAQAQTITVRLVKEENGDLQLTVDDNGIGMDGAHRKPGHFGLEGMYERAVMIGADLQISARGSGGTRVFLRFIP
ncbi:MAG: PDZ domain-containing protein [Anaerolineales bacterium]|nr:PDZ domain-containing protein [Anaerolineales bacterium]